MVDINRVLRCYKISQLKMTDYLIDNILKTEAMDNIGKTLNLKKEYILNM